MKQLAVFLYDQRLKDTLLAQRLALLELPNLVAMLLWVQNKATPEHVVALAERIETLLSPLGRPYPLSQVTRVREQVARRLGEWGYAQFIVESANIDRLLERGEMQLAYAASQQLLHRCMVGGEEAYPGAGYHIAYAHLKAGTVLNRREAAEAALS